MRNLLPKLQTLKRAQLQQIAIQCGINSSGTKAVLRPRVEEALSRVEPDDKHRNGDNNQKDAKKRRAGARKKAAEEGPSRRILSIDMGIRNLAYCVFDAPTEQWVGGPTSHAPRVSLRSWKRIAVASSAERTETEDGTAKESFEPSTYALYAYHLLSKVLRVHSPTHVLIERQRYRTFGSSAVLEWTVRVNMFEAMLHAVLCTLTGEDRWAGAVQAISPSKVAAFWQPTLLTHQDGIECERGKCNERRRAAHKLDVDVAKGKLNGRTTKLAKVNLIAKWLKTNEVVNLGTAEARSTAEAFLTKYNGTGSRRRSRGKAVKTKAVAAEELEVIDGSTKKGSMEGELDQEGNGEVLTKLDDLADCLLQGITFLQWQGNRRRIARELSAET